MSITYTNVREIGRDVIQATDSVTSITTQIPPADPGYLAFLAGGGVPTVVVGPHRAAMQAAAAAAAAGTLTPAQIQLLLSHLCRIMIDIF